ncbi:hypothetical protein Tsubulata_001680 [Turnera subulata]|uniref:FYVE-type domain-containing protein n=1 Tax=Turnera subulata TaxID=218843 RepID=A0A9Q0FKC5_9ROSI|nr:hypothetical protein Tsubulata_001680 [Turnera subulata]
MKTGARKSPPHLLMQLLSVELLLPPNFQMEWQILLVMRILNVTLSKVYLILRLIFFRLLLKALITLKRGTQLIKYSRKGKPKFRAFRLSPAVFRRYLRPEKDYLSFSLLYNGDRSLDLICKDKVEAEVWLAGLKSLIGNRGRRSKSCVSDIADGGDFFSSARPFGATLDLNPSIARSRLSVDLSRDLNSASSDAGSEYANMQLRPSTGDGMRLSVSSTPSCSSGGSGQDDIESLGDVYVWGEVWSDAVLSDGSVSSVPTKNDVLTPKLLESNVVLDVQQIACGVRHVALVTRQGEVFTWGEESGGRLGHGGERDLSHPQLVDCLAITSIEFVACGEYHTCAISASGDLFTWGDGTYNAGLLGHGSDVSHWIPKRVSGPLEGLQVLSIACGTWHSALATLSGKLFTFGDGSFGALGHGDRESVPYPKEVQSLSGLKVTKIACGVWHTAAIVEVMGHNGSNSSSRKLFTWGDGDKYRLGHGNKDTYLLPTCVSTLIDYSFLQLACGRTMTVALTASGHVFTMGATSYGQLGNGSDGKVPHLVQDKLVGEFVEQVFCGAHHVVVLTARSEVFSWGKGSNGQLGHGDTEDRKVPTFVEALRDRHVKNLSCGANFTSCVCAHKWVSGPDQSVCSGCRQPFGFTRKRHNCYNCGLVHCHACSSKKALKAALAPTPGKPHRVCDACYAKLKAAEAGNASSVNRKYGPSRRSVDRNDREVRPSRTLLSPSSDPLKLLDIKSGKPDASLRGSQVPSFLQLKDIAFGTSLSPFQWKQASPSMPAAPVVNPVQPPPPPSRPTSPYSRRPSPPRSINPGFSRSVIDSLKKTNELLKQDMTKMQTQIKGLKQKCETQDIELKKLQKSAKEGTVFAAAESSRSKTAMEFIKSIGEQLNQTMEQLPPEVNEKEDFKAMNDRIEVFLNTFKNSESASFPESLGDQRELEDQLDAMRMSDPQDSNNRLSSSNAEELVSQQSSENDSRTPEASTSEGEKEMIEQFEPGVYVTFIRRPNGTKIFKRVKFSKRRFQEQQAEEWWKENKDRLLKRYSPPKASASQPQPQAQSETFSTPVGSPSTAAAESVSTPTAQEDGTEA